MRGLPHYPLVPLVQCIAMNLEAARLTSPDVTVAGVALNTSRLPADAAEALCAATPPTSWACPARIRCAWASTGSSSGFWHAFPDRHGRALPARPSVRHLAGDTRTRPKSSPSRCTRMGMPAAARARPYARYGETPDSALARIEGVRDAVERGMTRAALQAALPPGAARNAPRLRLVGPRGAAARHLGPGDARPRAGGCAHRRAHRRDRHAGGDARRCRAPRRRAPGQGQAGARASRRAAARGARRASEARLIVDANESWDKVLLVGLQPLLAELAVEFVEQPLPAGEDMALVGFRPLVPLCADESCHVAADVARLADRYQCVNIKLDKTGGLTGALELLAAARAAGTKVMLAAWSRHRSRSPRPGRWRRRQTGSIATDPGGCARTGSAARASRTDSSFRPSPASGAELERGGGAPGVSRRCGRGRHPRHRRARRRARRSDMARARRTCRPRHRPPDRRAHALRRRQHHQELRRDGGARAGGRGQLVALPRAPATCSIRRCCRGVANAPAATVDGLLTHHAGVPSWEDQPAWQRAARGAGIDSARRWGAADGLDFVRGAAPVAAPGSYAYSNSHTTLLGLMIEAATGRSCGRGDPPTGDRPFRAGKRASRRVRAPGARPGAPPLSLRHGGVPGRRGACPRVPAGSARADRRDGVDARVRMGRRRPGPAPRTTCCASRWG